MRIAKVFPLIILLLAGCIPAVAVEPGAGLTPFVTDTPETASIETVESIPVEQTPIPVNTPTPVVHTVALGETISSIALQYGVTIDAIIAANPDIQPTVMIVGDTVIIPISSTNTTSFIAEDFAEDIVFSNSACFPALDGLLCTVLVKNTGENNFKDVILDFHLLDENGEAIAKISTPAALRKLEGGNTILASAFFDGKSDFSDVSVTVNWARFEEPIEEDSPQIVLENISTRIDGLTAQIGGVITADKAEGQADVTLVAAAFNAQGEVIGIRRQDSAIPSNTPVEFTIPVFSSGGPIAEIELYAELIEGIAE